MDIIPMNAKVERYTRSEIPPGAVRISDQKITSLQLEVVSDWKPGTEIWGLRYGGSILSATAGISGWLYLKHYGNVFMQSIRHGRMLVPAFAFPAVTAYAVNKMAIHQPLLLGNLDCSLCAETRAFVTQGICMTIQPFVASGLLNVIYAANYKNPILPNLLPLSGFMNFHKKVLLSSKQLTVFLLLANFVITNVVTRQQTLDSIKVNNRLIHGHNFPKESDSEELPEEL